MKIEHLPLAKLHPYAHNSRTHSPAQVEQIVASIREFGFTNPVLIDGQGGIIAGHGRVLAAGILKLPKVPCIRLAHLSETQKRAYVIADNKIAEGSGWDQAMLAQEIQALVDSGYDTAPLAFSDDEIDALLGEYTGSEDEGTLDNNAASSGPESGPEEGALPGASGATRKEPPGEGKATNYPIIIYLSREQYKAWRAHLGATEHHDGAQALMDLIAVPARGQQP